MADNNIRAEFGAWVESSTPKASGKGMRKVWVSPAPQGEPLRLSVIRSGERGDAHMLTLGVSTPELAQDALSALTLALEALAQAAQSPAPAAPRPTRKAPTPPTPVAPTQPTPAKSADRTAIITKARAERAALSVAPSPTVAANRAIALAAAPKTPTKAEPALDWFAQLMHDAGAV